MVEVVHKMTVGPWGTKSTLRKSEGFALMYSSVGVVARKAGQHRIIPFENVVDYAFVDPEAALALLDGPRLPPPAEVKPVSGKSAAAR